MSAAPALVSVGDDGVLNKEVSQTLSDVWIDRDLGWLDFNDRVLAEALDERTPLLERAKFLAIFTSNLDEFFMKRVAVSAKGVHAGAGAVCSRRFGSGCSRVCGARPNVSGTRLSQSWPATESTLENGTI